MEVHGTALNREDWNRRGIVRSSSRLMVYERKSSRKRQKPSWATLLSWNDFLSWALTYSTNLCWAMLAVGSKTLRNSRVIDRQIPTAPSSVYESTVDDGGGRVLLTLAPLVGKGFPCRLVQERGKWRGPRKPHDRVLVSAVNSVQRQFLPNGLPLMDVSLLNLH